MRYVIGFVAAALMTLAIPAPSAEACNARGQFCSYPAWASNAFAGKGGRVTNPYNSTNTRPANRR